MTTLVLSTLQDDVATITLNQPESLNAIGPEMLEALMAALRACAAGPARALVLTGAGRAFSPGADVKWFGAQAAGGTAHAQSAISRFQADGSALTQAIAEFPLPVVAAVNGPCAGAGAAVALAADVVLAARSAYFLIPQVSQLCIVPDLGATWILPRLVGRGRALAACVLGERIDAARAEQWGLIWRCVDDADLPEQAAAAARRLASGSAAAVRDTRRLIDAAFATPLEGQLNAEVELQRSHLGADFFREACGRFLTRGKPS